MRHAFGRGKERDTDPQSCAAPRKPAARGTQKAPPPFDPEGGNKRPRVMPSAVDAAVNDIAARGLL